jgi:predicted transposase YdaD
LPELTNPHDRLFKEVFSRPETAADFLANYLPSDVAGALNLTDLQLVKDSFVDSDLKEFFSDLLYRVRLGQTQDAFVYVLFEHKSAPDKWAAFQLLRYMVKIWTPMAEERGRRLPPIIPLVLYQGKRKWKVAKNFAALIDGGPADSLKNYVPEFEYHLCDLSRYDTDKLRGDLVLRIAILVMKNVFRPDPEVKLREVLGLARELLARDRDGLEYLQALLVYYSAAAKGLSKEDLRGAVKEALPRQEGRIMSTLAEEWMKEGRREGRREGRKEGIQEGVRKGASDLTLRLLHRKLGRVSARAQERILNLPTEELQELAIALSDFNGQKDLSAWLSKHA